MLKKVDTFKIQSNLFKYYQKEIRHQVIFYLFITLRDYLHKMKNISIIYVSIVSVA